MSGYTPVFDSVFDGTLCGKWPTLPVWLTILPMADKNGHIDLTYQAISSRSGWPIELLKQAFAELMSPDPESRSPEEQGRRLVLIDPENRSWGWRVINHRSYREKARKASSDAGRVARGENQKRMETRADPRRPARTRAHPPSDSDTNTDTNPSEKNPTKVATATGFRELEMVKAMYPRRSGSQPWDRAAKALRARLREGHKIETILDGLTRYAAWCKNTGKVGTETVMQAATFLGPGLHFQSGYEPPATKGEIRQQQNIDVSLSWLADQEAKDAQH